MTSRALIVTFSTVLSATVNVAWPDAFVVAYVLEGTALPPRMIWTLLPWSGLPY